MKTGLKLLIFAICVLLSMSLLTACGGDDTSDDGWKPTGKEIALIVKDEEAKYTIIFAESDENAKAGAALFETAISQNELPSAIDADAEFEILFGETSAEASKLANEALKIKVAEKKDDYHWVFYYSDGKLAIVANNALAYEFAVEDFFERHLTASGIVFKDTLNEHGTVTAKEYQDYLDEQERLAEEERQQQLDEEERLAAEEKKKEHEQYLGELTALLDAQRTELSAIKGTWDKYQAVDSRNNPEINLFTEYTHNMVAAASISFGSPAKYHTKGQHPRLLLTEDNLLLIRRMLRDDKGANDTFRALTERTIDNNSILPAAKKSSDGSIDNYTTTPLNTIQAKSLAYLLYGDEYYGYQAILYMKNYLMSLDIEYIPSDQCRYYGFVAFTAAIVYDWCYDLLTETDKIQLIAGVENCLFRDALNLKASESKMEVLFPPTGQAAIAGHGNEYQVLRDYLAFSVAIYDEVPSWYEYVGGRVYNNFRPAREYLYQSGVTWQGTGYSMTRHAPTLISAWILQVATGENPYSEVLHNAILGLFNYEVTPGYTFSDGDKTGDLWSVHSHLHLAYLAAYLYEDSSLLALADYLLDSGYGEGSNPFASVGYGGLQTVPFVVLRGLCKLEPSEDRYENMELIKYYGSYLGQYVVREAWDDESSAAVFMKIKERTTSGHEHMDAGTFEIYYKGMLTSDGGCYNNDGHTQSMYYHDATISHNGLIIFNPAYDRAGYEGGYYSGGQKRPPDTNGMSLNHWLQNKNMDTGKVTGRQHGYADEAKTKPLYAYIAGDITKAYEADTVTYVGRRMLTVYTGDEDVPMVFFVFDDIFANNRRFEKRFLLQITSSDEPTINGNTVITENGEGRLVLTCLSKNVRLDPVGGRAYTADGKYDGANSKNYFVNGVQMIPLNSNADDGHWGRVEIVSTANAAQTTFMNVLYVTDKGNDVSVDVSKPTATKGIEGAIFNEKIVAAFATDRNGAESELVFTVDADRESTDYYVSGLAAGKWSVSVDYEELGVYTVTEEGGLLTFTATDGKVVITPVSLEK